MTINHTIKSPRTLIRLMGIVIAIGVNTLFVAAQDQYAVLVGIDAYPGLSRLNGCLNDMRAFHQLLVQGFGLQESHILVLADKRATRREILEGLREMQSRVKPGDSFLFFYSGHGTLFPDVDSEIQDETRDIGPILNRKGEMIYERGRYDSAICPIDTWETTSGKPWKNLILDDELFELFSGFTQQGCSVVLYSDSCHSGTLAKGITSPFPTKYISPDEIFGERMNSTKSSNRARTKNIGDPKAGFKGRYVAITSSQDEQLSNMYIDIRREGCSLFTLVFCKLMSEQVERGGIIKFDDAFQRIGQEVEQLAVSSKLYPQSPRLDRQYLTPGLDIPIFSCPKQPTPDVYVVIRVKNSQGAMLPNAVFRLFSGSKEVLSGTTNDKGGFDSYPSQLRIRPGSYQMKVECPGYFPYEGEVEIQAGTGRCATCVLTSTLGSQN